MAKARVRVNDVKVHPRMGGNTIVVSLNILERIEPGERVEIELKTSTHIPIKSVRMRGSQYVPD